MTRFGVDTALRTEMMQRMSGGWDLVDRKPDRLTMKRLVPPPGWRIALDVINPMAWLLGGPTYREVVRVLHVWVDSDGNLCRKTTGDVPRGWQRNFPWEVPDGRVEP